MCFVFTVWDIDIDTISNHETQDTQIVKSSVVNFL